MKNYKKSQYELLHGSHGNVFYMIEIVLSVHPQQLSELCPRLTSQFQVFSPKLTAVKFCAFEFGKIMFQNRSIVIQSS